MTDYKKLYNDLCKRVVSVQKTLEYYKTNAEANAQNPHFPEDKKHHEGRAYGLSQGIDSIKNALSVHQMIAKEELL